MPVTRYTTVKGQIIAEKRGGTRSLYAADPLGSVAEGYDNSGTETAAYFYWPYGEVRDSSGTDLTPFTFCGTWGYYADSSGRTYVRARHYRPGLGRWQTVDPLWPLTAPYAYGQLSPGKMHDRSGLDSIAGNECDRCARRPAYPADKSRKFGRLPGANRRYLIIVGAPNERAGFLEDQGDSWWAGGALHNILCDRGYKVTTLMQPTIWEAYDELRNADGVAFFGHGGPYGGIFNTKRSSSHGTMSIGLDGRGHWLTPELIKAARGGRPLSEIYLAAFNLVNYDYEIASWYSASHNVYGKPGLTQYWDWNHGQLSRMPRHFVRRMKVSLTLPPSVTVK